MPEHWRTEGSIQITYYVYRYIVCLYHDCYSVYVDWGKVCWNEVEDVCANVSKASLIWIWELFKYLYKFLEILKPEELIISTSEPLMKNIWRNWCS